MIEFNRIEFRNIYSLLSLLIRFDSTNRDYLNGQYSRENQYFDETTEFLNKLGLIKITSKNVQLLKKTNQLVDNDSIDQEKLKLELINLLVLNTNKYHKNVYEYLNLFSELNGKLIHRPSLDERILFSGIRNFLIDLDFVVYNKTKNEYTIIDEYFEKVTKKLSTNKQLTPEQLNKLLEKNAKIGYEAEIAVIEFEKKQLKESPNQIKKIKHESEFDVTAGYDILSWRYNKNRKIFIPIYIEVKAVPHDEYTFHWSRNEILKAMELKHNYYLYLLPVGTNKSFKIEEMKIIIDPINNVFNNSDYWDKIEESYLVTRIKES